MKRKVNNRKVARLWATQAQDEAHGSNFYFRGDTIYSYGSHFPIARHITHKGKPAVLLTTRYYSVTTSKHTGYVLNALPTYAIVLPVVHPDVDFNEDEVLNHWKELYDSAMKRALRANKHGRWILETEIPMYVEKHNRIAEFLDRPERLQIVNEFQALVQKTIQRAKEHEERCTRNAVARRLTEVEDA